MRRFQLGREQPRFLLLGLALLFAFSAITEGARYTVRGPGTQLGSGVDIEVATLYQTLPARGFAPVRVTITNKSGSEQSWEFVFTSTADFNEGSLTHEATLTVADRNTRKFDIMVPLLRSNDYGALQASVYGPSVLPTERHLNFSGSSHGYHSGRPPATIAMSASLSGANWGKLEADDSGRTNALSDGAGSAFDPDLMPTDWRAYSGFDAVWLTDQEWLKAGASERLALLDWVAAGGRLYVCREEGDTTPLAGLEPLREDAPLARAFGTIHWWPRTGDDLAIESTRTEVLSSWPSLQNELKHSYGRTSWPLLGKLPEVRIRKGLFIGFLLLFAAVIGPVNLFFFARGTRRYRLFWTTPAISVGASVAIFLLILLQDGVGGTGHQLAVWTYLPQENKAAFLQEQASRTALLTGREFSIDAPVVLSSIGIRSLTSLSSANFEIGQRSYSGDWFRNRSAHGHLLEGVTATRWRIEPASPLSDDAPPELLSTFPFALDSIFYMDSGGIWWHAADLEAGQARRLQQVDPEFFEKTLAAFTADAGAVAKRRVRDLNGQPVHFYAFSNDSAEGTWTTLKSIDWETRKSLHTGPLAP